MLNWCRFSFFPPLCRRIILSLLWRQYSWTLLFSSSEDFVKVTEFYSLKTFLALSSSLFIGKDITASSEFDLEFDQSFFFFFFRDNLSWINFLLCLNDSKILCTLVSDAAIFTGKILHLLNFSQNSLLWIDSGLLQDEIISELIGIESMVTISITTMWIKYKNRCFMPCECKLRPVHISIAPLPMSSETFWQANKLLCCGEDPFWLSSQNLLSLKIMKVHLKLVHDRDS